MNVEGTALWLVVLLCACAAFLSFFKRPAGGQEELGCRRLIAALWLAACILAVLLTGLMIAHLLAHRFDYSYVAAHTDRALPVLYRISALWAGQEGSFLLWLTTLCLVGLALRNTKNYTVFGVYALITVLLAAMTAVSQPFARLSAVPADGTGLSLALQDPWMAVHPPLVFLGYSAMAVLAAYAAAGKEAAKTTLRHYTRLSLFFLGLGIFTGSIWAYRALGWGGFWAWDPIENAALVPWLVLCAYLHDSKPISPIKRIAPFALACLGTFLTRSGVLKEASVHAYAGGDSLVSLLILALVLLCTTGVLFYGVRSRKTKRGATAKPTPLEALQSVLSKAKAQHAAADSQPYAGLLARPLALSSQEGGALGMRIFARTTYGYAALILLFTLLPLATGRATHANVYNTLTVIYALVCTALLLLWDGEVLIRKGFLVLLINTALIFALMMVLNTAHAAALVLLWFMLLPISLYAAGAFKLDTYSLTHAALALLFVGAIASSLLGIEALSVSSSASPQLIIGGQPLHTANVLQQELSIVSTPLADYLVYGTQAVQTDAELFVPYTTKPLILLFWLGGFSVLGAALYRLVRALFRKSKSLPDERH